MERNNGIEINKFFLTVIVYLCGTISPVLMFLVVLYIFTFETDAMVKAAAKKSLMVWATLTAVNSVWIIIREITYMIGIDINKFNSFCNKVDTGWTILETAIFLGMAIKVCIEYFAPFSQETFVHINNEADSNNSIAINGTDVENHTEILFCRNCGNKLSSDDEFCSHCGSPK